MKNNIISVLLVTVLVVSLSPLVFGYSNHYDDVMNNNITQMWSLGNNLTEGDYFHYKICNDELMSQVIYPYHCYEIELEFVKLLESYKGKTWIVQGYLTIGNDIKSPMILFVNPYTFEVETDSMNVNLGNSLENTIFSLSKYGEKSLSIGTVWDELDSYFTNKINLEIKDKQSFTLLNIEIETSVLSYDIIKQSQTHLSYDYSFPLKSELYSLQIIFPEPRELSYYKLVDFHPKLTEDEYN